MKLTVYVKDALLNLFASKLRSLLALLGILVGTASVVAMLSEGELATQEALKQFKKLGTDLLAISLNEDNSPRKAALTTNKLTLQQVASISSINQAIVAVAPYMQVFNVVQYKGKALSSNALALTQELSEIIHIEMERGRFLSHLDGRAFYCVIGNSIYQEIKAETGDNPIGQKLKIGDNYFTIIGIAKPWPENSFFYADINHAIMIPILSATLLSNYAAINNLIIRLSAQADIDKVKKQLEAYFNKEAPHYTLLFRSAKELITGMNKQNKIFTLFLALIGGVSLIVGGIGIMNMMLVSVTERRREIGLRLSVGARPREICVLFMVEAVILSLLGGLIGMLFGSLISYFTALFWGWQYTLFVFPLFIGFGLSLVIGIFFGFYPAYQASKLDPIVALKAE